MGNLNFDACCAEREKTDKKKKKRLLNSILKQPDIHSVPRTEPLNLNSVSEEEFEGTRMLPVLAVEASQFDQKSDQDVI